MFTYSVISFEEKGSKHIGVEMCIRKKKCSQDFSGVHVLLVSLFGIPIVRSISNFFGRPKKILVYQKKFWYTKKKFGRLKKIWSTQKIFGMPKKNLVYQKKFGRPKKLEIDRTIGIPKTLTKHLSQAHCIVGSFVDFCMEKRK